MLAVMLIIGGGEEIVPRAGMLQRLAGHFVNALMGIFTAKEK